ncbi:PilZ domain-containing protein [Zavarzinella formosa]|uniref:PilZ domain-containing protein n=1 Tax=Zavarzinella formosa TaxID=360055 RepID=UPI0002F7642B|nr:PilZ domain-containing protein [Zavarzinella formosa]
MFRNQHSTETVVPERDKRLIRRKPVKRGVIARCRRGQLGLGQDLALGIIDISDSGMCLLVKTELRRGEEAEVEMIGVGRSKPIKILCEVRWIVFEDDERFRVGLRFRKRIPYADLNDYC